jgi:outer membrane protein TolC
MKEITDAHETYRNARFVLQLEKRNLSAAELNFKRTEELFHLGQVTNTQFREAQLNLIRALSTISNAKYTAKLNELELLRLSGMLIEE